MRSQAFLKFTHTWIGLIVGAFICITCLSGSILVFKQEIENALAPGVGHAAQRVSLEDAIARVASANPQAKLTRVSFHADSYVATLESGDKHSQRVLIDAGTGQAVGTIGVGWVEWISDLHHNLLFSKTGRKIQGGVGGVLFVTSLTGVVLFLMRKPSWRSATTVHATPPRRFYLDLHRVTGVWVYVFLAVLSGTGFALGFPELLGKAAPVPKAQRAVGKSLRPLGEYLAVARASVPGAEIHEIRLPKSTKDPVSIRYHLASDLGSVGRNEIVLEASTGRVLGIRDLQGLPLGPRWQRAMTPIHYAEFGGLAIKCLWFLAGIMPTILFITGMLFWLQKTAKSQKGPAVQQELAESLHA